MTDRDTDGAYEGESFTEALPGIIAVSTLGLAAIAAVLGQGQIAGLIAAVGWLLLTPLTAILADTELVRSIGRSRSREGARNRDQTLVEDDEHAALAELKRRYARGEIDEAEFERRTAMLLENETIEDVRERVDRSERRAGDRGERRAGDRSVDRAERHDGREDRQREREFET